MVICTKGAQRTQDINDFTVVTNVLGFPGDSVVKNPPGSERHRRRGFNS